MTTDGDVTTTTAPQLETGTSTSNDNIIETTVHDHDDVTSSHLVADDVVGSQVVSQMHKIGEENGTNEHEVEETRRSLDSETEQHGVIDLEKEEKLENESTDELQDKIIMDQEYRSNITLGHENSHDNGNGKVLGGSDEQADYRAGDRSQHKEQPTVTDVKDSVDIELATPNLMGYPDVSYSEKASDATENEVDESDHREVVKDDSSHDDSSDDDVDDFNLQKRHKDKTFSILRLIVSHSKKNHDNTGDIDDDASRDNTDDESDEYDDESYDKEDDKSSPKLGRVVSQLDIIQFKLRPRPTQAPSVLSSPTYTSSFLSPPKYESPTPTINKYHHPDPGMSTVSSIRKSYSRQSPPYDAQLNHLTSDNSRRVSETLEPADHVLMQSPEPHETKGPMNGPVGSVNSEVLPLPNLCRLPAIRGYCFDRLIRWHYDVTSQSCRQFEYSGCGGNMNNFNDLSECMNACHSRGQTSICNDGRFCTNEGIRLFSLKPGTSIVVPVKTHHADCKMRP